MSGGRRKKSAECIPQDLTLASYANSTDPKPRYRKSDSVISTAEASPAIEEDWFEREEDDIIADVEKIKVRGTRQLETEEDVGFSSQIFPYDFWFLLGGYIEPEFIGTFAQISRVTRHVVSTQVFWRRLYSRYYRIDQDVGPHFSPESMSRLLGYRTRVIKLLHLIYPRFRLTLAQKSSFWPDLNNLVGRVCTLHWTSKISRQQCYFYFKLKDPHTSQQKYKHTEFFAEESDDFCVSRRLLDDLSDINHNTEQGCKLLQVLNVGWCQLQPVLGLRLKSVSLSVSNEMKHHKLCLDFGPPASKSSDIRVTLNSVLNVKVLNWWNPQYKGNPA